MNSNAKTNKKQNNRRQTNAPNKKKRVPNQKKNKGINIVSQTQSILHSGIGKTLAKIPSVERFASVYMNPFQKTSARLPCWPVNPSYLITTWGLGQGQTNSDGFGWACMNSVNGACYNIGCMSISTGTNPDTFSPTNNTGVQAVYSNSPYNSSTFQFLEGEVTNNHMIRPVAVGIRVRYSGTNLDKGGYIYLGTRSNRGSQDFPVAMTDVPSWPGYKNLPLNGEWHGVHRSITESQDFLYQSLFASDTFTGWVYNSDKTMVSLDNYYNSMIFIKSAKPNMPFEAEFYGHYEIMGTNLPNSKVELPHNDQVQKVVAVKKMNDIKNPHTEMIRPPSEGSSTFGKVAKEVGVDLLAGILGGM